MTDDIPQSDTPNSSGAASLLDTAIINSAVDFAIIGMDTAGVVTRWNSGAEHILGWSPAEAIGQIGEIIFTLEDRSAGKPQEEIRESIREGRSIDERWHVRKDQTRFWGSGEMMPLRAADGSRIGLLKIVRDRTERWLSEQKVLTLAKLGEGLANMVEPRDMAALASELVRVTLNATAAGYASVEGDPALDGFSIAAESGLTVEALKEVVRAYTATGRTDLVATDSPGSLGLHETDIRACCIVPVYEGGRIGALFAIVSDVQRPWTIEETQFVQEISIRSRLAIERRKAEERLREFANSLERQVERRLAERNRLWSSTQDLMTIVSPDGMIHELNPAWTRALGWEEEDLKGRPMLDITDEVGARALQRAIAGESPESQFQIDMKSKSGDQHRVQWTISRDADMAYLVGRDVTIQLRIEARLRQSQKMEAIGQLTGGIAHDFNNLLAGIIGSLDLLRLRITNNRLNDIERHCQAARTAAHRAAALTHRLLAFARQQPLDPTPVDVNRLVAGMEELIRRTLQVRFELELKLDASCMVLTDTHQMENAILNLVINARDAMPRGGKITITAEDCSAPLRQTHVNPAARYTCISVADEGEGIPPDILSRVFEPFFTTKPAGQGTGLGLAMIYGFVQQMNGEIDLQSEVGRGTTVRLYLPCIEEPASPPPDADSSAIALRGSGERILVVEDDENVRNTIVEMLREINYRPVGVASAKAAVPVLESSEPLHLLITDWELPGLDGGELALWARDLRKDLPVLFLTGHTALPEQTDNPPAHQSLLTKPIGIESLSQVVAEVLKGGATEKPE